MSFIEFDPKRFDPEADAPCDLASSVTRQAWAILTAHAKVDEEDVTLPTYDLTYALMTTDSINPLVKNNVVYFDQMPFINNEAMPEIGLFAMKIVHARNGSLLQQVIFRSELHPNGAAVFYDDMTPEQQVTDEEELLRLSVRLQQLNDAFWASAGQSTETLMNLFPVAKDVLGVEAFLKDR